MGQTRLGLAGGMCAGKTSVAEQYKGLEPRTQIISFASPVKELAVDLFRMETKDRNLLQQIGTSMRNIDPSVWVNKLIRSVDTTAHAVIVDDVRYPNEALSLKRNGFTIVWLDVDDAERKKRIDQLYKKSAGEHLEGLSHPSENGGLIRGLADREFDTSQMSSTLIASSLHTMSGAGSSSAFSEAGITDWNSIEDAIALPSSPPVSHVQSAATSPTSLWRCSGE